MIGSRLLFSGYGCGFKSRPLHAGFLGQDALLVHDEAHLEPAFQTLVEAIEAEQLRARDFRRLRILQLTATARQGGGGFALSAADLQDGEIATRVTARKGISIHSVPDKKALASTACERAMQFRNSGSAVIIFLRALADVESVSHKLQKEGCQVQRLTGTLRGYERDLLMRNDPILARFLHGSTLAPLAGTVYLVSTSAGEVGVNLSAEHAICDLTPIDSMIQRLGRINRFGRGDAQVDLLPVPMPEKPFPFDEACGRTLALLNELPLREDARLDASPLALSRLDEARRLAAFTPQPEILPSNDILFDTWALTSIRGELPGRPAVADWLHGVESDEPHTAMAWRLEVGLITGALLEAYAPADLLEDFPLKPHEVLRDASYRIVEQLEKIAGRVPDAPIWVVGSDNEVEVKTLSEFAAGGDRKRRARELSDCTVVLPPIAGGLEDGFLAGASAFSESREYDIGDQWTDEKGVLRRRRVWDQEIPARGMRLIRTIDLRFGQEESGEEDNSPRLWSWYVMAAAGDDDGSRVATAPQELSWHCDTAEAYAARLAGALALEPIEARALELAAAWHDRGKNRELWQRGIGNRQYPRGGAGKVGWQTGCDRLEPLPPRIRFVTGSGKRRFRRGIGCRDAGVGAPSDSGPSWQGKTSFSGSRSIRPERFGGAMPARRQGNTGALCAAAEAVRPLGIGLSRVAVARRRRAGVAE